MKPKKERPSALSDSIFRARLGQAPDGELGRVPEEIPVHNTFIQFGAPPSSSDHKKPPTTAPAWIGPSFQSIIQQASTDAPAPEAASQNGAAPEPNGAPPTLKADSLFPEGQNSEPFFAPEDDDPSQERPPLGSPQKVPLMRYALSSSSARAAGLPEWSPTVVAPVAKVTVEGEDDVAEGTSGARSAALGPIGSPAGAAVPMGSLPSAGSALHHEGACKRCCFFPKGRCQNGLSCEFCHFEHEKRKRKKKKKNAGARRDGNAGGSESESEDDETGPPGGVEYGADIGANPWAQPEAGSRLPGGHTQHGGGAWPSQPPDPIGHLRAGLPLTAPPALPPRGLPVPSEPPPPAPIPVGAGQGALDPFYGAYGLGAGSPYGAPDILGGYGAYDSRSPAGRPGGLGGVGINQSYFGGGYDPAAIAAQQQQAAYPQQAPGRYLPPPR